MTEERRLPDGEGVWFDDRGDWVAIRRYKEGEWWVIRSCGDRLVAANRDLNKLLGLLSARPGRWKRAEPPEFQPQEPRPPMVWAKVPDGAPRWRVLRPARFDFVDVMTGTPLIARDLTVVPHPQNDPGAARIIEEAQRDG